MKMQSPNLVTLGWPLDWRWKSILGKSVGTALLRVFRQNMLKSLGKSLPGHTLASKAVPSEAAEDAFPSPAMVPTKGYYIR